MLCEARAGRGLRAAVAAIGPWITLDRFIFTPKRKRHRQAEEAWDRVRPGHSLEERSGTGDE